MPNRGKDPTPQGRTPQTGPRHRENLDETPGGDPLRKRQPPRRPGAMIISPRSRRFLITLFLGFPDKTVSPFIIPGVRSAGGSYVSTELGIFPAGGSISHYRLRDVAPLPFGRLRKTAQAAEKEWSLFRRPIRSLVLEYRPSLGEFIDAEATAATEAPAARTARGTREARATRRAREAWATWRAREAWATWCTRGARTTRRAWEARATRRAWTAGRASKATPASEATGAAKATEALLG